MEKRKLLLTLTKIDRELTDLRVKLKEMQYLQEKLYEELYRKKKQIDRFKKELGIKDDNV